MYTKDGQMILKQRKSCRGKDDDLCDALKRTNLIGIVLASTSKSKPRTITKGEDYLIIRYE